MRSKWNTILAIFAAACMLGVVGTASASAALPEFTPSGGKFPVAFTATSAGKPKIEWASGIVSECSSVSLAGEFTGGKEIRKTVMTFSNCNSAVGGECSNGGKAIKSEPLKGTLGYIKKTTHEVGLELEGEAEHGVSEEPLWANSISCFSVGGKLRGELIGRISPVNTFTNKFTIRYQETHGKQEPTNFEGGPLNQQLSWQVLSKELFGLGAEEEVLTMGKEGEIRA